MNISPPIRQRYFDSNGLPLAGGNLYSYAAGTAAPQVTYSDSTGTPNTNPVVLDASGYADVWLNPALYYKFVLKDSLGNTLWTEDNVTALVSISTLPTTVVSGTESVGISVVAGTSIPINLTALDQIIFVAGSGGVVMSANPQIQAGTIVGQRLTIIGTSDIDYVTFSDGNGLSKNGPSTLKNRNSDDYRWSGSVWTETARREN